jgi:hypothetical protein
MGREWDGVDAMGKLGWREEGLGRGVKRDEGALFERRNRAAKWGDDEWKARGVEHDRMEC